MLARVAPVLADDGKEAAVVEVVLVELARRELAALAVPGGREHLDQLVRVDEAAPPQSIDALLVVREAAAAVRPTAEGSGP